MPYQKFGFATPEAYAAEIKRKEQAGQTLTNQAAADTFKAANPNLFQQNQTALRSLYPAATYNQGQVGLGGATFQSGQIPGTTLTGGTHYVNDQTALQNAIRAQLAKVSGQPGVGTNTGAGSSLLGAGQGFDWRSEASPEAISWLDRLRSYIDQPPQSIDQMMQGDYYKGLKGAADAQTSDQMMQAKAQLAGAGGLYPDDTRAASRFAEEGERASARLNQIIPHLVQAAQGQRASGLDELLQGFGAQSGQERDAFNRLLSTFQTTAPFNMMTESERQRLRIEWAGAIGEVPGSSPGQAGQATGGLIQARDYVTQKGGSIFHRVVNGRHIITINGRDIDVLAVGGNLDGGRAYLPQSVIDVALGAR